MSASPLKDREPISFPPDNEPIAGVGNMAFPTTRPITLKVMHVMPAS